MRFGDQPQFVEQCRLFAGDLYSNRQRKGPNGDRLADIVDQIDTDRINFSV